MNDERPEKQALANLVLGTWSDIPRVDYTQPALCTWQQFYDFRNHVLRVLRRFGSAGPMGEVDLSVEDEDDAPAFESGTVKEPNFFVVDDMYNEHDRLSIVECDVRLIRNDLVDALCEMEKDFPDWWVHFSLGDSGLRISSDRMLCGGRRFWDCKTVAQVVDRCARPVDFGPAEPFSEEMYLLWVMVICGQFGPSTPRYEPPTRQWVEILHHLDDLSSRKRDGRLNRFDYGQIRLDIHPKTRREFVLRFLDQIEGIPAELLKEATGNLEKDLGYVLLNANDSEDCRLIARKISVAQDALRDRIPRGDVFYWWPYIVSGMGEQTTPWKTCLADELRHRVENSEPSSQLSAVFSLALLGVENISEVVAAAFEGNPDWSTNPELSKWLGKLKAGSRGYPSSSFLPLGEDGTSTQLS